MVCLMRELRIAGIALVALLTTAISSQFARAQEVRQSPKAEPVRAWDLRQGGNVGSIEVALVDASGALMPKCSVSVFETYGVEVASGLTGPTGKWAVTNLRPNKYVLKAACQGFVTQLRVVPVAVDPLQALRFDMTVSPTVDFIEVDRAGSPNEMARDRRAAATTTPSSSWTGIEVAVTDDRGKSVTKADVALVDAEGRSVPIVNHLDGFWLTSVPLRPGRYEVNILAHGFWFQQFEDIEVLSGRPTKLEAKLAPVLFEEAPLSPKVVEVEPSPESNETVK
jgi:hypothetical protein